MRKYWTVFNISWQNGFVYRLNFLLWRFRNLVVILTTYFLWDAVFYNSPTILGYTRERILTYVFLALILRSLILGQRSMDAAGEISDGRLSNYLVKPLNHSWYWLTRDLADKILNLAFGVFEIGVLYLLLHPPVFFQTNISILIIFFLVVVGAIILNYLLGTIASYFSFWTPENSWGFWFLLLVFQDFLGGVMFPTDIFPRQIYQIIMLLPFPYLLYFPANVYLGKITSPALNFGLFILAFWIFASYFLSKFIWQKGLYRYQSEGK